MLKMSPLYIVYSMKTAQYWELSGNKRLGIRPVAEIHHRLSVIYGNVPVGDDVMWYGIYPVLTVGMWVTPREAVVYIYNAVYVP